MIRSKVITEELIIYRCTHQYYPHFRVQTNHSFNGEQDKISINVSLMHFVKQNERVLLEKLSTVHKSLQKNTIRYKDNSILRIDVRLHSNLITNHP